MKSRVKKWGNSLALRIPKPLAAEVGLRDDSAVELSLRDGKLVVTPAIEFKFDLDELLARVTDENIHDAVETGPAVGNEGW
jgi:antitoxin MazE